MNKLRASGTRQAGFSLLELLVAFAIMAIALGMLYRAAGGSARAVGKTEVVQQAVLVAESVLAMRDAVPPAGWSDSGESAGFAWQVFSTRFSSNLDGPSVPLLHEIEIVVSWREGNGSQSINLYTLLPETKLIGKGLKR